LLLTSTFLCGWQLGLEPDPINVNLERQTDFLKKITLNNNESLLWQLKDYMPETEKHIIVLIPSYNNSNWYKKNLDSIFMQKYSNYHIIYVDDASTDGTGDLVEEYARQRGQEHRTIIIRNKENRKALANIYSVLHSSLCQDTDIIASCDGDDWWCNEYVLQTLNKVYQKYDTWVTYGEVINVSYTENKRTNFKPYPERVIKERAYRTAPWILTGLRTYYVWLFRKIRKEDLMRDGRFFESAWDLAIMYPMLEMAGDKHAFIPDVFYAVNRSTGLNDFVIHAHEQRDHGKYIRAQKHYPQLDLAA
jgi:glycosyltransferase involved in cell wall biosynthesis